MTEAWESVRKRFNTRSELAFGIPDISSQRSLWTLYLRKSMSQLLFPLQGKPYLPLKGTQASSASLVNMELQYLPPNPRNWRQVLLLVPFLHFNAPRGFCHKLSAESLEMRKYMWASKHRSRDELTLIRTRLHMYAQCFDRGIWAIDLFFKRLF